MSEKSEPCELKIALFYNGDPEEFFVFIRNFNVNFKASGTLETDAKVQCLFMLVLDEALRQFDLLSADVYSTNILTVEDII